MTDVDGPARFVRPVTSDALLTELPGALAGGEPIAPMPDAAMDRRAMLEMLRPELPLVEPDAAVVVATSGSTGRPKGVVLSRAAVVASVTATHDRLGGPGDWALALPTHYVAGMMVAARCIVAGTTVHPVLSDLSGLASVPAAMRGRRYISLVPTQLVRACADEALVEALSTFDRVLLGGAAADPALVRLAQDRGIPIVVTYGMSETCGGCVYDGVPLDAVSVELEVHSDRILIGGPTLFSGYRLRPELSAAALERGRFRTEDRGLWQQDRLSMTGRLDDVVVSGGVNVDLAAVEQAALGWPALDGGEIAVVGVPHPEWGTEVVAVTNAWATAAELRGYLRQTLPAEAAPRRLARVSALPRTSSGKIDRQRLIAELSASSERADHGAAQHRGWSSS